MKTLNVDVKDVIGWSDSTIVLCQLNNSPARYKTFVANRIAAATSVLPPSAWNHVPTADNPADCGSRGVSAEELRGHSLWWSGPPWLKMEPIAVPRQPQKSDLDSLKDHGAKPAACLVVSSNPTTWFEHKFLSYWKLLYVTARLKRSIFNFSASCRGHPQNKDNRLSLDELRAAELFLIQSSQRRAFPAEFKQLTAIPPKTLSSSSKLLHLRPVLGQDGLLHIGGRLSQAPIPIEQKHPIILSAHDVFVKLLFKYDHVLLSHCGPTLLISHEGRDHFVIGARRLARTVCRQCITCRKVAATAQTQQMGQLPAARVQPASPFFTTGIDYAGPFILKRGYTRKPQLVKAWLAVFVCFTTKAVHLEVVSDMTNEAFLATLKRFVSRRGLPQAIHADNGSNFIGAKNDLKALYVFLQDTYKEDVIHTYLQKHKVEWHCIPERAPHFGGLWEAAVKSAKHHLKRVLGEQQLNFEEMSTVAAQVEACLNSRPLGAYYCHSPDGVVPLTPGHFLVGRSLHAYPETKVDAKMELCKRWNLCQAVTQHFWDRWSKEYLQQMQASRKWATATPSLEVGDMVLVKDDFAFQQHWSLAKVTATYPGDDGLVRAVDIMTATVTRPASKDGTPTPHNKMKVVTKTYRRPVSKLALLIPAHPPGPTRPDDERNLS